MVALLRTSRICEGIGPRFRDTTSQCSTCRHLRRLTSRPSAPPSLHHHHCCRAHTTWHTVKCHSLVPFASLFLLSTSLPSRTCQGMHADWSMGSIVQLSLGHCITSSSPSPPYFHPLPHGRLSWCSQKPFDKVVFLSLLSPLISNWAGQ